jgi:hypothetical protein
MTMEIVRYKHDNIQDNLKNHDEEKVAGDKTKIIEAGGNIAQIPEAKVTPITFGNKV